MSLANRKPLESAVEKHLIKRVKESGGKCAKFTVPGENGHPDRLVKLPGFRAFLVELKRPGEEPRPGQRRRHREWRDVGMEVYVADSRGQVDDIFRGFVA